jgi:hypothetical protein
MSWTSSLVDQIGGLFGGTPNNSGFVAQAPNLIQPTTAAQTNAALAQSQGALGQQNLLAQALAAQGGIGNQGQVFGMQNALAQQMGQSNGLGAQNAALQGYQNIANGTGPNVAQNMLNQATGQNIANQGAMMAGQRGAGANVGLMARQIGNQGANIQQQSAGQAALMQAQQQQAALGQMAGIGAQQAGQLQNQQNMMGNTAQQQIANQLNATGQYGNAAQQQQGMLLNALQGQNALTTQAQSNANLTNQAMAAQNAKAQQGLAGGLLGMAGNALMPMASSAGNTLGDLGNSAWNGLGNMVSNVGAGGITAGTGAEAIGGAAEEIAPYAAMAAKGGMVEMPHHLSHIHSIFHGHKMAKGGTVEKYEKTNEDFSKAPVMEAGGKVPGKPKVDHNSYENDVVKAKLSPGEIVIPLDVMNSEDPVKGAADFVAKILEKKDGTVKSKSGDEHADFKEALKSAIKNRKAK